MSGDLIDEVEVNVPTLRAVSDAVNVTVDGIARGALGLPVEGVGVAIRTMVGDVTWAMTHDRWWEDA